MKQSIASQSTPVDFIELDSVTTRRELGTFLDQIKHHKRRFTISKRGQAMALLVPISDQSVIEASARAEQLQQTYQALDQMVGLAKDSTLTDVSQHVNDYAYGLQHHAEVDA